MRPYPCLVSRVDLVEHASDLSFAPVFLPTVEISTRLAAL